MQVDSFSISCVNLYRTMLAMTQAPVQGTVCTAPQLPVWGTVCSTSQARFASLWSTLVLAKGKRN
jgi:hypothetical protein